MNPDPQPEVSEPVPPASRGTLILSDVLLARSESAAVILRSAVGYDEGIKIETEFLLRRAGAATRPLRGALDPQLADPAISFGSNTAGEFRSLTWNDQAGSLHVWTLSAHEQHSRLSVRTWLEPVPDQLIVGVRWLSQGIGAAQLSVDCRHDGSWTAPPRPLDGPTRDRG